MKKPKLKSVVFKTPNAKAIPKALEALKGLLLRMRWDYQGGYPHRHKDKWGFERINLGSVSSKELDVLFDAVGIVPDEIEPLGDCEDCANAQIYKDGSRGERGYERPCVSCSRPYHDQFIPLRRKKLDL